MMNDRRVSKDTSTRFHRELDMDRLQAGYDGMQMTEKDWAHVPEEYRGGARELWEKIFHERQVVLDRLKARQEASVGSMPTDAFFMDRGEAPHPAMTRTGGIPYWPKNRPWPTNWRGIPMTFVAQINFADSGDLFDGLPGDILVVFRGHRGGLKGYWLPAELEDVIGLEDVPESVCVKSFQQHGVVQRLYDGPLDPEPLKGVRKSRVLECIEVSGEWWVSRSKRPKGARLLFQLHGVKIAEWDYDDNDYDEDDEPLPDDVELCECGPCEPKSDRLLPPISGFWTQSGKLKVRYERPPIWNDFVDNDGYKFNRLGLWLMNRSAPDGGLIAYGRLFQRTMMKQAK